MSLARGRFVKVKLPGAVCGSMARSQLKSGPSGSAACEDPDTPTRSTPGLSVDLANCFPLTLPVPMVGLMVHWFSKNGPAAKPMSLLVAASGVLPLLKDAGLLQ